MRIVLTGTSTEIGKTYVGVQLLKALSREGVPCVGLKPIESGLCEGATSDRELLSDAGTFHVKHWPYGFDEAISPHLAAENASSEIDVATVLEWVASQPSCVQLIELPGGLLSPLSPNANNLDLVRGLTPTHVIVVAPDKLGVLGDVTSLVLALRARAPELPKLRVVLNAPATSDASTGTNSQSLRQLTVEVLASFRRDVPDDDTALEVLRTLRLLEVDGPDRAQEKLDEWRSS